MGQRRKRRKQATGSRAGRPALRPQPRGSRSWKIPVTGLLIALAAASGWLLFRARGNWGLPNGFPSTPDSSQMGSALRELIVETDAQARALPDSARAIGRLGLVYHANHYFDEARKAYDLAVTLDTENPDWWYYKVLLEEEVGELEKLQSLLSKTLEIDPEHLGAKKKLADVMVKQGQAEEAARLYAEVLETDTALVRAAFGLARVAYEREHWVLVRRSLEPMLQTHPAIRQPHQLLARAYRELGETDLAEEQERILEKEDLQTSLPSLDPYRDRLNSLCRLPTPLLKMAYTAEYTGEFEEMLRFSRRAVESDPRDADARHVLARALVWVHGRNPQKLREAESHVQQGLQLRPRYVDPILLLSEALLAVGAFEVAERCLRRFVEIRPEVEQAHNDLGRALAERGKTEEALSSYSEALRLRPDYAQAHNNLCIGLLDLGRLEKAFRHCSEALRVEPDYVEAHNNLGLVLAEQGRVREAIKYYRAALKLDPDHAEAHNNLGIALASLGRTEEAATSFAEAVRIRPGFAQAHNNLALALLGQSKLDSAISHLQKALANDPDYVEAHYNLALAYSKKGEPLKAVQHFTEVTRLMPDSANAHHDLGVLLCRLGDYDRAMENLSRAVRLAPGVEKARSSLQMCLGEKRRAGQD